MNPEVRAAWVAALRSGEYEQGQGYLRQRDADGVNKFCCLGVLCDLAVKAGVEIEIEQADDVHLDKTLTKYDGSTLVMPDSVREWAGLMSTSPAFKHHLVNELSPSILAVINDEGCSFRIIADIIETGMEVLA